MRPRHVRQHQHLRAAVDLTSVHWHPEVADGDTTLADGYGLGLYNVAEGYADAVGHSGEHIDGTYVSWAGCLPEHGTVVVVLGNQGLADVDATARSLVTAVIAGLRVAGR
jgi:CubicO group peptidase (beta-lactamase class C family)